MILCAGVIANLLFWLEATPMQKCRALIEEHHKERE